MSRSFIDGPPREGASLQELMLYLKPKSRGALSSELRRVLTSTATPTVEEENWGLITELGMNPAEFAQLALSRPELWDKGQTEYLETIAGGYPPNDFIIELAEDFFTEAAAPPPKLEESELELEDEDLEDEEDLDPTQQHERALTALVAPSPALTPINSGETLPIVGAANDDWWKKK